ncbi:6 TM domain-containing transmembrane protein [Acrasis kona]|uniref:6 TM domain-containing transmembrane protein n=1 Tax=Acrasis kona TaxID=1008807 RepID=A0AAW2ZMC6_9EUKA
MSTIHQRKSNVSNIKRKQQGSTTSTNIDEKENKLSKSVTREFSALINQPTVTPEIPYEILITFYLTTNLLMQYYNIYGANFYNYDFNVMCFSGSVVYLRMLIKFTSNNNLASPFAKVVTTPTPSSVHMSDVDVAMGGAAAVDKKSHSKTQARDANAAIPPTQQEQYRFTIRWWVLLLHSVILALVFVVAYFTIIIFLKLYVYTAAFIIPRIMDIIRLKKQLIASLSNDKRSTKHQIQQQRSIIDASMQTKILLYTTFELVYFTGMLPLGFAQDHIYYEKLKCITQLLYMIANVLVMLCLQLLSNHFLKFVSHTHFFGYWQQITTSPSSSQIQTWTPGKKSYSKGSIVTFEKKVYVAMGEHNYGQPGQLTDRFLFVLFCEKPDRSHCYLICIQYAITLSQLVLFLSCTLQSTALDEYLSKRSSSLFEMLSWEICVVMLLFNYYLCHLCIWVRRKTLQFLLLLAQSTAHGQLSMTQVTPTTFDPSSMKQDT